jgi:hypothetical protein
LTILVAILTAVFANIDRDTAAESLFRRTVVIFSGIKSDGLFNYQPPINLLAFCFLVPIRFFLSSRKFHSLNVLCTRIFSSPILIIVAIVEGRHLRHLPPSWRDFSHRCRAQWIRLGRMWNPRRDIDLVFETKHFHAAASEPAEVARRDEQRRLSVLGHGKRQKSQSRFSNIRSPTPTRPVTPQPHGPRPRRESMLASIYAPQPRAVNLHEINDHLNERLAAIEETQKHIQEVSRTVCFRALAELSGQALNALLDADNPAEGS